MDKKKYNLLPLTEQAIMLWDKGNFIALWEKAGEYKVGVYTLFNQMVSVHYCHKMATIVQIKMWGMALGKNEVLGLVTSH